MEAIFAAALLHVNAAVDRAVSEHGLDRRSILQLSKEVLAAQLERLAAGAEFYVEHAVTKNGLDRRSVLQFSKEVLTAQQEQLAEGAEVTAPDSFLYLPTSGWRLIYGSVGDGNDQPHGLDVGVEYGRRAGFALGPERVPSPRG